MTGPLLEVTDLVVRYGRGAPVLDGVSLTVAAGETVGLIGETGSGKSTLARAVLGLVPVTSGDVAIGGEQVSAFGARQWRSFRRRGVAQYVFQDPLRSLDPDLTVEQSITEPLLIAGTDRPTARERARAGLARVRLDPDLAGRLPGELSGGQRQRVAVARALVGDPRLLLLDEPVSALDSATRVGVLELLRELRGTGVGQLFVSHDLGSVAGVADRVAVLHRGRLVETGPVAEVIGDPQHPYTRLLVGSAPTLRGTPASRAERAELRALLDA